MKSLHFALGASALASVLVCESASGQELAVSLKIDRSAAAAQQIVAGPGAQFGPGSVVWTNPAQTQYSFDIGYSFATTDDLNTWASSVLDEYNRTSTVSSLASQWDKFEYDGGCFRDADLSSIYNVSPDTVFDRCDAIDFSVTINNVALNVHGSQNAPDLSFAIPSLGIAFTSVGAANRESAPLIQFGDYLKANDQTDRIAAALLGEASGFVIPNGALPASGSLFSLDGAIARSAAAADPLDPVDLPAQTAARYSLAFGFSSIQEFLAYAIANTDATLADFGLAGATYQDGCSFNGTAVTGRCDSVDVTVSVLGVAAHLTSAENDPNFTLSIPAIGYSYTSTAAATPFGGFSREDSGQQIGDDLQASGAVDDLFAQLAAGLIAQRADDPLLGNPASMQGEFLRMTLDMDRQSDLLDESGSGVRGDRDRDPAGWMIGARGGTLTAGQSEATFLEGVAERSGRLREGGRARWKVSIPLSVIDYSGFDEPQSSGSIRGSLELPLREGRWVVEPTAGIGYVFETEQFSAGALYLGGLSSRIKILSPVGRGHFVIGDAVAYTSTIPIEGSGYVKTPEIENTTFRNGIAYQLPVGGRIGGRLASVRASFVNTLIEGDPVFLDDYNDVSLSYGISSREASARNIAEMFRIGVSGSFGQDYESYSANLGYRF